jgi:nucleoside phosphorylase
MFFVASARLAEATADVGDLAEQLDAYLSEANESWLLRAAEVASTLSARPDRVEYLLETATLDEIGLLRREEYLECEHCDNLMPIEDVREAIDEEETALCSQCQRRLSGEENVAVAYRLSDEAASEARARAARPKRKAVILTALELELRALHVLLTDLRRVVHEAGTVYHVGRLETASASWEIPTVAVGAGNPGAAAEAERAITRWHPEFVLFVGVAGGIKGVELGDVVAATEVYGYHAGKALDEFKPRPDVWKSAYGLVSQARAAALEENWQARIVGPTGGWPKAIVEPIAAGEQVVASTRSATYLFIREAYSRAVAVEMEGAGFLRAAYGNQQVEALVVRGISDMLGDKEQADQDGWQPVAAGNAAAFAIEILANLP